MKRGARTIRCVFNKTELVSRRTCAAARGILRSRFIDFQMEKTRRTEMTTRNQKLEADVKAGGCQDAHVHRRRCREALAIQVLRWPF